ncbi:MAG: DUF493 domain-containing protein [Deferribacteraceae bacterium]|nr:DUF493 domain-containing protein [Deferribacteraceae bacterium]
MSNIKDYIEFPVIYTFKIVGDNEPKFITAIKGIFSGYEGAEFVINLSSGAKYASISATTEIKNYEELESVYKQIAATEGLKFHV